MGPRTKRCLSLHPLELEIKMLKILFNILYTIWLVVNIIDIMQMFPLDSNVVFTMCLATGFPNIDARLLVGTVFTTWTIFSEL